MTLDDILGDIHAMREDLLIFERKYGIPSEVFFEAYQHGEEPADNAWVLDWSQWAGAFKILQERIDAYNEQVKRLVASSEYRTLSELIAHTARHESVPIAG